MQVHSHIQFLLQKFFHSSEMAIIVKATEANLICTSQKGWFFFKINLQFQLLYIPCILRKLLSYQWRFYFFVTACCLFFKFLLIDRAEHGTASWFPLKMSGFLFLIFLIDFCLQLKFLVLQHLNPGKVIWLCLLIDQIRVTPIHLNPIISEKFLDARTIIVGHLSKIL